MALFLEKHIRGSISLLGCCGIRIFRTVKSLREAPIRTFSSGCSPYFTEDALTFPCEYLCGRKSVTNGGTRQTEHVPETSDTTIAAGND